MKYSNTIKVKELKKISVEKMEKDLATLKSEFEKYQLKSIKNKITLKENMLSYAKGIQKILKENKNLEQDFVGISFYPNFKKLKKDKIYTSKLGGVPSCFFKYLQNIDNKKECFEILNKVYPKTKDGEFLKFIGDFDTRHPSLFLNSILPVVLRKDDCEIGQLNVKGRERDKSALFSVFVDENYGMLDLSSNGVLKTLNYEWKSGEYSPEHEEKYILLVKEFMDLYVYKEKSISIDKYKAQEIISWRIDLETLDESCDGVSSLNKEGVQLMKIFGYPQSQQNVPVLYCVNGRFGPRPMNSFLTLFSQENDNIIQLYGDLLTFNSSENTDMDFKTDISST